MSHRRNQTRSFLPLQASSFPSKLAHSRRPNRVHGGPPLGGPLFRTGHSRPVALHPVFPRRSYGSIPHGSLPHRNGLPPFCYPAFSGALVTARRAAASTPNRTKRTWQQHAYSSPQAAFGVRNNAFSPRKLFVNDLIRFDSFKTCFTKGSLAR